MPPIANQRILMLPGMGADHRLFEPLRPWMPSIEVPEWPPTQGCRTIRDSALRFAEQLRDPPGIICGCSFGGALALELAHLLRPQYLLLLGAPLRRDELCLPLRAVAGLPWPGRRGGATAVRLARLPIGRGLVFGLKSRHDRELFEDMLRVTPDDRLSWMIEAMLAWKSPGLPACAFHRIHGTADRLIRATSPGTHWIRGAGHTLTLTHPEAVGRILQSLLGNGEEGAV